MLINNSYVELVDLSEFYSHLTIIKLRNKYIIKPYGNKIFNLLYSSVYCISQIISICKEAVLTSNSSGRYPP